MVLGNKLRILKGFNDLLIRIQNNEWKDYDFTNSVYINNKTKLEVSCRFHGEFWISPSHLKRGQGCAKCAGKYRRTPEDYRRDLGESFPEYEVLEGYQGALTKILHKHKTCGHGWKVTPSHILGGYGCPKCATSGFDSTKPAILYYIAVSPPKELIKFKEDNSLLPIKEVFKIGITNRSIKQRFSNTEVQRIRVIKEEYFEDGQEAYNKEQEILLKVSGSKYKGVPILKSGITEMFYKGIK